MYLVFDTETTGLPRNRSAPHSDLNNWPRLVQAAWLLFDRQEKLLESENRIIFPEGFSIPDDAARLHRITTQRAVDEGESIRDVLEAFSECVDRSEILIAHNMAFDESVIGAEFLRAEIPHRISSKERICTMMAGTEVCQIPGPYGFKWPTLPELYFTLFKKEFIEAHDASLDVAVCARCFFKMKDLRLV